MASKEMIPSIEKIVPGASVPHSAEVVVDAAGPVLGLSHVAMLLFPNEMRAADYDDSVTDTTSDD